MSLVERSGCVYRLMFAQTEGFSFQIHEIPRFAPNLQKSDQAAARETPLCLPATLFTKRLPKLQTRSDTTTSRYYSL